MSETTEQGVVFTHKDDKWPPILEATINGVPIKLTQVDVIGFQKLFAKYRIGGEDGQFKRSND